jgi:hypothetical protein
MIVLLRAQSPAPAIDKHTSEDQTEIGISSGIDSVAENDVA